MAKALVKRGESVRGIDNFATGKRENIAAIEQEIDFREADLLDPFAMADACAGVDVVFHEAAIPSVPKERKRSLYKQSRQRRRYSQPAHCGARCWGEESDPTYIDNVVAANLLAAHAPAAQVSGQVFNIACGQSISLNKAVRLLQDLTGFEGATIYGEERAGDIKHSLAEISAARELLGYHPRVDFRTGLARTVEWYRETLATVGRTKQAATESATGLAIHPDTLASHAQM